MREIRGKTALTGAPPELVGISLDWQPRRDTFLVDIDEKGLAVRLAESRGAALKFYAAVQRSRAKRSSAAWRKRLAVGTA
jgi:hypothetical protein